MAIYGQRPQDVVTDNRGNALRGITIKLFANEVDALGAQNQLGTAVTDTAGRWRFEHTGELWVRLPNATVWRVDTVDSTSGNGVSDHGALTGLADDDHPQYHTDARGDARYYLKAEVDDAIADIPGASWDTLPGKPATFPSDPHSHAANTLAFTPAGSLSATNVQAAIEQAAAIVAAPPVYDVKHVYYVSGAYEALPGSPDPAWRLVIFHGPTAPTPPSGGGWATVLFDWAVRA